MAPSTGGEMAVPNREGTVVPREGMVVSRATEADR